LTDYGTITDAEGLRWGYDPIHLWDWITNNHTLSYAYFELELFVRDNVLVFKDCGEHNYFGGCKIIHQHIGEFGTEVVRWVFGV